MSQFRQYGPILCMTPRSLEIVKTVGVGRINTTGRALNVQPETLIMAIDLYDSFLSRAVDGFRDTAAVHADLARVFCPEDCRDAGGGMNIHAVFGWIATESALACLVITVKMNESLAPLFEEVLSDSNKAMKNDEKILRAVALEDAINGGELDYYSAPWGFIKAKLTARSTAQLKSDELRKEREVVKSEAAGRLARAENFVLQMVQWSLPYKNVTGDLAEMIADIFYEGRRSCTQMASMKQQTDVIHNRALAKLKDAWTFNDLRKFRRGDAAIGILHYIVKDSNAPEACVLCWDRISRHHMTEDALNFAERFTYLVQQTTVCEKKMKE